MYTIGQVSEMFNLPVSTLRYYDKEGLFPFMQRASGIRQFSDTEIAALKLIECLKKSGLEIRDIKQFMEWRQEKDMPVFMYIFLNKIEDTEEVRWTEKEKNEGYKTYKKLLELAEDDASDVIKKCLRIIKETRHIVEYELWNKIVYFMTDYINGETVWG